MCIRDRVRDAWNYRKETIDTSSCRLIFGEADFLPGIVIDKFSDVLVVESLALGIDKWKLVIIDALKKVLAEDGITIRGVYERSDAKVRLQEGMERYKGFIGEPFDTKVEIVENGVHYMVDVEDGQKTGFFLDQKNNRAAIHRFCKDKKVLDCFTHTGSFALNAGIAGAKSVLGVDASQLAVDQATENAKLNGLDNCKFIAGDVLKVLDDLTEKPDVIVLDPPRDGIHPKALPKILSYGVNRIVYVSCKATSLARDLEAFLQAGYRLEKACCVDQFCETVWTEAVALLVKE